MQFKGFAVRRCKHPEEVIEKEDRGEGYRVPLRNLLTDANVVFSLQR